MSKYPKGKHPNSLKTLAKHRANGFTEENAREMQQRGADAKKAKAEARRALKASVQDYKSLQEALGDDMPSAIDVLRIEMAKALQAGDSDTAVDLAGKLAEYETPKLARQENFNTEISADEMSDEEIEQKLREFSVIKGGKASGE